MSPKVEDVEVMFGPPTLIMEAVDEADPIPTITWPPLLVLLAILVIFTILVMRVSPNPDFFLLGVFMFL